MRVPARIALLTLALTGCATTPQPATDGAAVGGAAAGGRTSGGSSGVVLTAGADPAVVRARFVAGAKAMLGQPYRWGGAAPGGFDCSGLVAYAAGGAGLRLPRTAAEQLRVGSSIPRRELRAGDLVFMHLKHKELHVGIAIDADRFVNAPASGGQVRIDSLSTPAYARGFLQARRLLQD